MAKTELGGKHKCQNCGAKFFDLNKSPITCPKCGTIVEAAASSIPSARSKQSNDEDEDNEEDRAEVVSLEDADATDDGKVKTSDEEDVDLEEDDDTGSDDDDTFLEEDEEDDGNVSDLIDGDIEDEEER